MSDDVIATETGLEALERLVPRPHVTSLSPLLAQVRLEAREVIQVTSSSAGVVLFHVLTTHYYIHSTHFILT